MDDIRVGAVIRDVRRRRGLRQSDVARLAGASQQTVSEIERGRLEDVGLPMARRIARVLEVQLPVAPRWRGPELDRLLDLDHARLVEWLVRELAGAGWEIIPEYTYNHFGERGAVDLVAWHHASQTLLIAEVKTRIVDVQDLLGGVDRKVRLVPRLLNGERGWSARAVGRVIVLPAQASTYAAVARHAATFDASFPARSRTVRRWLRDPRGSIAGLLFVRFTARGGAKDERPRGQRIRRPRSGREAG